MRPILRPLLLSLLALTCAGCSIVYRLPTRQGNVIDQKQFEQVQIGMTKEQVKFLLGTPIAADPFRSDRWDYFGYYKSPRGQVSSRNIALFFDGNKLARTEGLQLAGNDKTLGTPDLDTLAKQQKKDRAEQARDAGPKGKDSGVNVPTGP